MGQAVALLATRRQVGGRDAVGQPTGGGARVGAQASAPSSRAYRPSEPNAAPPASTGTPTAWQAVIAEWAVGRRVAREEERATASAPVLWRWVTRCGVGTWAPRKSTRQPRRVRTSASSRAGRACHSWSTQATVIRPP